MATTRVCSRPATHTVAVVARQNESRTVRWASRCRRRPSASAGVSRSSARRAGPPALSRTAKLTGTSATNRWPTEVQEPEERDRRPVPLVEHQPVERHPVAAQPDQLVHRHPPLRPVPDVVRDARRPTPLAVPAHDLGRYRSASSRAWKGPFATPRWTVTMPLSILPTQLAGIIHQRPRCGHPIPMPGQITPGTAVGSQRRRTAPYPQSLVRVVPRFIPSSRLRHGRTPGDVLTDVFKEVPIGPTAAQAAPRSGGNSRSPSPPP